MRAVVGAVSRPVNVLAHPGLDLDALRDAGVRRVSVGGLLAWTAVAGVVDAARQILDEGSFGGLRFPPRELGGWLAQSPDG